MTVVIEDLERRVRVLEEEVSAMRSRNQVLTGGVPDAFRFGQGTPTVKEVDHPVSTIKIPVVPTVEVKAAGGQQVEFMRKSELTDEKIRELKLDEGEVNKLLQPIQDQPVPNYDDMTQGEVLLAVKKIKTVEERDRMLSYERAHKNRDVIVTTLVNWNS